MRYDALIIGAGMSGLAAGIRLAQAGKRVAILERHYLWGGLNSFYKRAGRRFETGLHALTNYAAKGTPNVPLTRILRQLRIPHDALKLAPQRRSITALRTSGGDTLRLSYSNDMALLRSEVARLFPAQQDGFERLVAALPGYSGSSESDYATSARARIAEYVSDPLLVEMLMIAPLFYGSPTENDMSWAEYGILFRSIHLEGMARPEGGIKELLDLLIARFEQEGGELRMKTGVAAVLHGDGKVRGVRLDDGSELECERVLSSAGLVETEALCGTPSAREDDDRIGRLSFVETCCVLDRAPLELGHDATIVFYSDGERFRYERPEVPVEPRCGVITCPSNYQLREPDREHFVRITCPANYAYWKGLPEAAYAQEKTLAVESMLATAESFSFPIRPHTVFRDSFTPRTIERFTGHRGGAVYGSPRKSRDGFTSLRGLELIGTDQGLVGVIGAMLSGITIANRSLLEPAGGAA